jgi:hypothetical protein
MLIKLNLNLNLEQLAYRLFDNKYKSSTLTKHSAIVLENSIGHCDITCLGTCFCIFLSKVQQKYNLYMLLCHSSSSSSLFHNIVMTCVL